MAKTKERRIVYRVKSLKAVKGWAWELDDAVVVVVVCLLLLAWVPLLWVPLLWVCW